VTGSQRRIRLVVTGVVQGVGFRYFVLRAARERRLRGFVANRRDGSVEVVAEGPRWELEHLARDVARGPGYGHVDAVETEWSEPTGEFADFGVRFER